MITIQKTRRYACSLWLCIWLLGTAITTDAAIVETKHGPREGRAIVRQFDERLVITILAQNALTQNERIYQFYGKDVEAIQANEAVLIGRETLLRSQPQADAQPVHGEPLSHGLEVEILSDPDESDWLRVRIWGDHQGWIEKSALTNRVEELNQPLNNRDAWLEESAAADETGAATASVPNATAAAEVTGATE